MMRLVTDRPLTVSEMARLGGKARAQKLTKEERSASARKAVEARWQKQKQTIKESLTKVRKTGSEVRDTVKGLPKAASRKKT